MSGRTEDGVGINCSPGSGEGAGHWGTGNENWGGTHATNWEQDGAANSDDIKLHGNDNFDNKANGNSAAIGTSFKDNLDDEHRPQSNVACRNCNEEGHFSKDCPNRGPPPGPCPYCSSTEHWRFQCPEKPDVETCFRCNSTEHRLRDCPEPPKAIICRVCEGEGHMGKDCPNIVCKNCGQAGHRIGECSNSRKIDRSHIADATGEDAWKKIEAAAKERDMDDVKEAIEMYLKAVPDTTYPLLEHAFRTQDVPVWVIALERPELAVTMTNMDLQGNLDRKYTISYRFSDKPTRPREREGWPSKEENLSRLENAGIPVPRGLPKCNNCSKLGHTSKRCPEERIERVDKEEIKCIYCDQIGHRARDCPDKPEAREPRTCRNCGSTEHMARDCDQPRAAGDDVECYKCHGTGHFSRDCPNSGAAGGGGGSRACFKCGEEGHISRECPNRGVGNLSCYNCGQEGHMSRDCPEPRKIRGRGKDDAVSKGLPDTGFGGEGDSSSVGDKKEAFEGTEETNGDDGWATAGGDGW